MTRLDRRAFLAGAAALPALPPQVPLPREGAVRRVATNTYPWSTFATREQQPFALHSDALLAAIASTGIAGYEPGITTVAELEGLGPRLARHGLEMPSIYVNSTLHDADAVEASLREVLRIAEAAAALGTRIVVTNPSPIRWGGPEDKTDAQLARQAAALDRLGAALRQRGLRLAYHNHDAELRQAGREFHHMLTATDPAHVGFCLDAHWVFRGAGNSQVALFDVVEHYGARIVELHLRQSNGGIWTEVFAAGGDIDYGRLATWLARHGVDAQITLEQAVERGSPRTIDAIAAHRQGLAAARAVFG